MRTFISFVIGLLVGLGAYWFYDREISPRNVGGSDRLDGESIRDDMNRTGRSVREKVNDAGAAIANATSDERITASIKARLVEETALTGFKIDVDTVNGVVTLSGAVPSQDAIDKAIQISEKTEGVRKVVSTLQLKQE